MERAQFERKAEGKLALQGMSETYTLTSMLWGGVISRKMSNYMILSKTSFLVRFLVYLDPIKYNKSDRGI